MQQCKKFMENAWTYEKMPEYMLKLPQGANTNGKHQMGLNPIKELKKFSQNLESQPSFRKSLIFKTLSTNSA